MSRQNAGTYQIRVMTSTNGVASAWGLGVPASMAVVIPRDMRFRPEFTDDGILYRPIVEGESAPVKPPSWAQ